MIVIATIIVVCVCVCVHERDLRLASESRVSKCVHVDANRRKEILHSRQTTKTRGTAVNKHTLKLMIYENTILVESVRIKHYK